MNRKACLLVVLAVLTLVCVLTNDEAAAQAITVTPANPTISVGQTQRFTATGVGAVTAVDLGAFYSCALLQDGTVRCWGDNSTGELGDGTTTNASTPGAAAGISGAATVTAVALGALYTCALLQDGTVRCWGDNTWGELGNGAVLVSPSPTSPVTPTPTPVTVSGITTAVAIEAGVFHMCALLRDGTLQCWGRGEDRKSVV